MIKGIAALNVYKKVALVRRSTDTLTFEDEDGNVQAISDLAEAASASTPTLYQKPKLEIPTPRITTVDAYDRDIPPTFASPRSYVRYYRPSFGELESTLEYVADAEDEAWHKNFKPGGSRSSGTCEDGSTKAQRSFPLDAFERMMDILEKSTGFETIVSVDQAEKEITKKMPELVYTFPSRTKHIIGEVYNYWMQKRSKLKRPLLRRFWPVTASDDTNPHLVFRPREKEKYKLRKKRQNDMDAFRKMKQLRSDFEKVRVLLDLVARREKLNRSIIQIQAQWFKQRLFEIVDTSGEAAVEASNLQEMFATAKVPNYFDVSSVGTGGNKRRKRRKFGDLDGSRNSSPVAGTMDGPTERGSVPSVIAGQNHGEPAPLFLHPLQSRESYAASWENAVPFVSSYIDTHSEPTFRFRHRPRIGRGGRLCIDRLPRPLNPDIPPLTVFTAGKGLTTSLEPKERLLDLLPKPLDEAVVSRRIEEICLQALKEDYSNTTGPGAPHDPDENDCNEVVVRVEDWLGTDDQIWGEERFAVGPI